MLRPRLRIPRIGRIGLSAQGPAPQLAPLAQSFQQQSRIQQSRSKHTVPPLSLDITNGIDGFLSAGSTEMAWTQYQTLMLEKLDQKTAETDFYDKDIKSIILSTAREPQHAAVFNYASMAHNNHFFFDKLANETVPMPELLQKYIEQSFGSVETLRREMVYTAEAMFGPGFVWLVRVQHPGLPAAFKVLTTYLAGTPYSGAHWRRQDVDANTDVGISTEQALENGRRLRDNTALGQLVSNKKKFEAAGVKKPSIAPGGIDVHPILCLNTWEHVWLRDYGIGVGGMGGKLEYAEAWWYRVDWNKVAKGANLLKGIELEGKPVGGQVRLGL